MLRVGSALVIFYGLIYIIANLNLSFAVKLQFTNLKCEAKDPSFVVINECRLRVIKRGLVGLNIRFQPLQKATAISLNIDLYRKFNGYKPFLRSSSFNFCLFKATTQINPVSRIFMNFVLDYSNLNHTCPYENEIIIKDLILAEEKFKMIPYPSGEYMAKISIDMNGKLRTIISAYFSRIE